MTLKDKQKQWNEVENVVRNLINSNEQHIDEVMFEAVVALHALGFKPIHACQGYHREWGLIAPRVTFSVFTDEERKNLFQESDKKRSIMVNLLEEYKVNQAMDYGLVEKASEEYHNLMREQNAPEMRQASKLADLLTEFYKKRHVSFVYRLILDSPLVSLRNQGSFFQEIQTEEEQVTLLNEFEKEMADFTEFLKKKYFEE